MGATSTKVNPFAPSTLTLNVSDIAPSKPRMVPVPKAEHAPDPEHQRLLEKAELRQVAEDAGFNIDNYEEKPIKPAKKPPAPPCFLKTFRLRVSDYNHFQRWCDRNGYSVQEGFHILVANNIPTGNS